MKLTSRRARALAVVAALGLAGCDLGPEGPSAVDGLVRGHPALGAAVLDVTWPGVVAFEGRGSTQVYAAPVAGEPNRWRVVLVSPSISELPFTVQVESAFADVPVVTVVEAANIGDDAVDPGELSVVLER